MKKALFLALALLLVANVALAITILNSKHDLSSGSTNTVLKSNVAPNGTDQVCAFCHTPHNANTADNAPPLWNKKLPTNGSYTTYNSATFDMGAASATLGPQSLGCMSCHDGTVAIDSMFDKPGSGGLIAGNSAGYTWAGTDAGQVSGLGILLNVSASIGTNLSGTHPVSFTYDPSLDKDGNGFPTAVNGAIAGSNSASYRLFSSKFECATCHSVHDPNNVLNPAPTAQFVRGVMAGSKMCLDCHKNK